MPTGRKSHAASVVEEKIYVIAGRNDNSSDLTENLVTEYDPATDTWKEKKNMPTPRLGLGTCVVNGKIYAIGGVPKLAYVYQEGEKSVFEYNPAKGIIDKAAK